MVGLDGLMFYLLELYLIRVATVDAKSVEISIWLVGGDRLADWVYKYWVGVGVLTTSLLTTFPELLQWMHMNMEKFVSLISC